MNRTAFRFHFLFALALVTTAASAVTMPDGFVYRARCAPATSSADVPKTVDVTLRLYEGEETVTPSWTGSFPGVTLVTNGLFQIWVSEAAHASSVHGESRLEQVLQSGTGAWLGMTFGTGRECRPRRMLVTAPLANAAAAAGTLDPSSTVEDLRDCQSLVANRATVGTVVCDTFEFGNVSSGVFNLENLNARSVTLSRAAGNRILSRSRGTWTEAVLGPGSAITNKLGRAAFLTIRSTDGSRVAPLLTVPVPAGEAFVWPAVSAKCSWRFVAIGAE